jgi:hypothetical protein
MIYVKQYNAVESLAKRHPILIFSATNGGSVIQLEWTGGKRLNEK